MARKRSNLNLPGALHYVTANFLERAPVFTDPECCKVFLDELQTLNTTGLALGRFTHRVISHWLWIMIGGGRRTQRSCRRR